MADHETFIRELKWPYYTGIHYLNNNIHSAVIHVGYVSGDIPEKKYIYIF